MLQLQHSLKALIVNVQGALTPSLICCESGRIDSCGVCDGFDLCESAFSFYAVADSLTASSGSARDAFVAEFSALACSALGMSQLCSRIAVHRIASAPAVGRRLLANTRMLVRT